VTWLDDVALETVIVHTTESMSFKGLKVTVYDDSVVLREARVLEDEGMSTILNGEVVIPRDRVHFIQRVPENGQ
jgi:hypothetical protein